MFDASSGPGSCGQPRKAELRSPIGVRGRLHLLRDPLPHLLLPPGILEENNSNYNNPKPYPSLVSTSSSRGSDCSSRPCLQGYLGLVALFFFPSKTQLVANDDGYERSGYEQLPAAPPGPEQAQATATPEEDDYVCPEYKV